MASRTTEAGGGPKASGAVLPDASGANGLGLAGLTAMVVTTCVGAGIFSLAGDLAQGGANTAAVLVSWVICFVGVLALAKTFSGLAAVRPELAGGIYAYAAEFGDYVGFSSAWGYWISACLNNAGYGVMLFSALSYFFPVFQGGNNVPAIVCASAFLWLLAFLLSRGVGVAAGVNLVITLAKLVPLALFILCVPLMAKFDPAVFLDHFTGEPGGLAFGEQINSTMVSLVWLFVGLEGAVVVSGRARDTRDVGRATTIGFVLVIVFYILISVLSLGVMTRAELATLPTPSLAGVFEHVIGPAGAALVNGGVVVSLMGTMIGYLTFASETSHQAARRGIFPPLLARENAHGTAVVTTALSAGVTQAFFVLSLFASSTYQFFYTCSVYAVLIPYACSALYYATIAWRADRMTGPAAPALWTARLFGSLAFVYVAYLVCSSGTACFTVMAIAVAPGFLVYVLMRRRQGKSLFPETADVMFALFVVAAIVSTVALALTGGLSL